MLSVILSFVVSLLPHMPVTIQHDLTEMLLGHFQTIPGHAIDHIPWFAG